MTREPTLSMHRENRASGLAVALAAAVCLVPSIAPAASSPRSTEQREIDALTEQLEALSGELEQLRTQNRTLLELQRRMEQKQDELERRLTQNEHGPTSVANVVAQSSNPAPPASNPVPPASNPVPPSPSSPAAVPSNSPFGGLSLWGYGEIYYTRPTFDVEQSQADLARAVFGIGYTFNDRTEFNSEFEEEHAVASATDPGEFEIEQFYIDRRLNDSVSLRAGLFLMPFGFLNEHHEPIYFYGVQRNFVETLIIPSTWREGGLSLHGDTDIGIAWSAGVTTGINLAKWEFAPEFPQFTTALELENNDVAPLQATHQELALASARNLSQYVSINYFGLPGLDLGAAAFTGKAEPAPGTVGDSRVTLWEGHARWTPGRFDLSALYAHGAISNVAAANLLNPGSPNPIPSAFYGYFLQAAYGAWESGDYRLNPFVRWEYYDLGSEYSGAAPQIPTGTIPLSDAPGDFGSWPQNRDRVWTTGVNFYVTPHVVFKADYQWFDINKAFNRFDLGLGLNF